MRRRSGHAPGHIRDTFLEAIEAYDGWYRSGGGQLPTVTREIRYEPHQISLTEACGLVWNCTDLLSGHAFDTMTDICEEQDVPLRRRTYAAAAEAMLTMLKAAEARLA